MKRKFRNVALIVISSFLLWLPRVNSAAESGSLVFQDSFSSAGPAWQLSLLEMDHDRLALRYSRAIVANGRLELKANATCADEFGVALATLTRRLPQEFVVEFRASKLQGCGELHVSISEAPDIREMWPLDQTLYDYSIVWDRFGPLELAISAASQTLAPAPTGAVALSAFQQHRIEKRRDSLKVFIDGQLKYSHSGPLFNGGILNLWAHKAGATIWIDDLRIYDITAPELAVEVASVRLKFTAAANAMYEIQRSSGLDDWQTVTTVVGHGGETNIVASVDGPFQYFRVLRP